MDFKHVCYVGVCANSEDIIIVFFIVPPKGVELVVINHVNPRKNNVNLGVKKKKKDKNKLLNVFYCPPRVVGLVG